jgi:hypothetical protein
MVGVFKHGCVMVMVPRSLRLSDFVKFVEILGREAGASQSVIDAVVALCVGDTSGERWTPPGLEHTLQPVRTRVIAQWSSTHDNIPPFTSVYDEDCDLEFVGVRGEFLETVRSVLGWREHAHILSHFMQAGRAELVVDKFVRVFEGMSYIAQHQPTTPTVVFASEVIGVVNMQSKLVELTGRFRTLWGIANLASKQYLAVQKRLAAKWASVSRSKHWLSEVVGAV